MNGDEPDRSEPAANGARHARRPPPPPRDGSGDPRGGRRPHRRAGAPRHDDQRGRGPLGRRARDRLPALPQSGRDARRRDAGLARPRSGAPGRRPRGEPADARRGVARRPRRAVVPGDAAGARGDPAERRERRHRPLDRVPAARGDGTDVPRARGRRRFPHRHPRRRSPTTSSSGRSSTACCTAAGSPTRARRRRSSTSCSTGSGFASRARSSLVPPPGLRRGRQCADAPHRRDRGRRRRPDPRLVLRPREPPVRPAEGLRPVRHQVGGGRRHRPPDGVQPGLLQPVPRAGHPRGAGARRHRPGRGGAGGRPVRLRVHGRGGRRAAGDEPPVPGRLRWSRPSRPWSRSSRGCCSPP